MTSKHALPSYLNPEDLGPWGVYLEQIDRVTPYLGNLSRWVETLKRPKRILTVVLILLVLVVATQVLTRRSDWSVVYPDANAGCSPWMVGLLAVPSFVLLAARVRLEAPTHLNVSGAALGLTSGGVGAFVYAFGCREVSASLDLSWLSVGIGLSTVAGMLMAPRLLRW